MIKMDIVSLPSYKCYWSQQLRYSPVADAMSRNRSNCFQKTSTWSIMMKLIRMTNLLKLDQLLILFVISVLKLNWRSATAWTSKLYHLKQNFQVYGNITQKSLKNGTLITWSVLGLPELCTIISFMKENQRQLIEMTILIMTIYKNQHKLLQSYVRIFLAIKTINCFSIIGFLLQN